MELIQGWSTSDGQPVVCTLVRSRRKTIGLRVTGPGRVEIRGPFQASPKEILEVLDRHRRWLEQRLSLATETAARGDPPLTPAEVRRLAEEAVRVIPERVHAYAALIGVTYGRITIRCQKTRWGSCSAKGNLNFNCLLMLAPGDVLDSVIVHELCHRLEMNHSPAFWREVYRVMPDYDARHAWLKTNGPALLKRVGP